MTVQFRGIDRKAEITQVTESGLRVLTLHGPKAAYFAIERAVQPGSFIVFNSRQRVVGNLRETEGRFVEY